MDLVKQYILQSITTASGNLRLNNQRIEVIAMLKDSIFKSTDVQFTLNQMKKITELSKLAIKLSEMHQYLNEGNIDFLKLSDKFREHSFNLIKEINHMLDMVNPYSFKETLERIKANETKVVEVILDEEVTDVNGSLDNTNSVSQSAEVKEQDEARLPNDLDTEDNDKEKDKDYESKEISSNGLSATKESKEEPKKNLNIQSFDSFENTILKPIKTIDEMLNKITENSELPTELDEYSKIMNANANLSSKNGFEILAKMHLIIADGMQHLKNRSLPPTKEVIESFRACLIVIVAVVKSKEVNIRSYLNQAELFGKFLKKIKSEEIK